MKLLRTRRSRVVALGFVGVLYVNGTFVAPVMRARIDSAEAQTMGYKQKYGHWDVITLPADQRISAVHAAMLNDGKILITAGSGNNATPSRPAPSSLRCTTRRPIGKVIDTPTDLFCGGQAFCPRPAADRRWHPELRGAQAGREEGRWRRHYQHYRHLGHRPADRSQHRSARCQRAEVRHRRQRLASAGHSQDRPEGLEYLVPGRATVWANAANEGTAAVYKSTARLGLTVAGLPAADQAKLTLTSGNMGIANTTSKDRPTATSSTPDTETYLRVANMTIKRWYPTLTTLSDGAGRVRPGRQQSLERPGP